MNTACDIRRALAAGAACLLAVPAYGQNWPQRPVRLVVPYTPGGGADIVARVLGQRLAVQTGGSFVIDNRPGAGGINAAELVAHATPDGHTLLASATEFGTNAALRTRMPFDPFKDFAHISLLGYVQFLLAGNPAVPVRNIKELIALAKTRPGELTYGSTSLGGGPHLAGELIQSMGGIRWVHVPFKGAGPASVALISGEISFMFSSTGSLVGLVQAGKVRAIAVTGPRRFPELPEVPTVAESGIPGYSATGWYGLFAPAGTPPQLVHRISAEAARAYSNPQARERLAQIGVDPVGSTPGEFVSFLRTEIAKWSKVVKEANIRID